MKKTNMELTRAEEAYRRFRQGDPGSFDEVMELFREPLIFFLLRYLSHPEDAEDAAEDALVELLLHPWKEHGGASLKTYLFTLGRSRALNLLKKQKRRSIPLQDLPEESDTEVEALEERVCQSETRRELLRALGTLAPDQREALYLLYFEELSLGETARVMKKSKKQVENLAYRGKQALRGRLAEKDTADLLR